MPGSPCCCKKCCCRHFPSSYEFTLSGIENDPFNPNCCVCDSFNATIAVDFVGKVGRCATYMSAPFNSCEDGEEEDIGALVAYLSLALEAGICVGRLYFVLESIVDPETFELTETLQLITSCGSGNYAAMFATFLGGGEDGIPEDNCPENDLRFSAPEESMCRFWPGTAPSYLHLVPTP